MPSNFARIALAVCCLAGCGREVFRAETKLEANGRVTRAIFQPKGETPESVRKPGVWSGGMTYSVERPAEPWGSPISSLPPLPEGQLPYFAAWGTFDSVAKLPEHYVVKAGSGLPDGKLVRKYETKDYGFVTEHLWRETLTDIVTIDDMHQARDELTRLLIDTGDDILRETFGNEYDFTDLAHWFDTEGRTWVAEILDVFFHSAGRTKGDKAWFDEFSSAALRICRRHGLDLPDLSEGLKEADLLQQTVMPFARDVVRRTVKRRDGRAVSDNVIEQIVATIFSGCSASRADDDLKANLPPALQVANAKVIVRRFGSDEKFQERLLPLAIRIFGLYRLRFLAPPRPFYYTLEVPGVITRTNGVFVSDHVVEWTFSAIDAYPHGYTMECRFLVPDTDRQKKLLNATPLTERNSLVKFAALVTHDQALRDTLRESITDESLTPLRSRLANRRLAAKKELLGTKEHEATKLELDHLERLFRLLKLTEP
ncbi:MAG: hypothetical protein HZA46_24480 [Planctomycetales bacterium]|nr:hypothetical protein [Planctomycetales bacterium]